MEDERDKLRTNLSLATEEYFSSDDPVHTISSPDADVIYELVLLLRKLDCPPVILNIINSYKSEDVPDVQMVTLLREFGSKFQGFGRKKLYWVEICKDLFPIEEIFSIGKQDNYCPKRSKLIYSLVVNKTNNTKINSNFANREFEFARQIDRDKYLDSLKEKMKAFTNVVFL